VEIDYATIVIIYLPKRRGVARWVLFYNIYRETI